MRVVVIFILILVAFNTLPMSAFLEHEHVDSRDGVLVTDSALVLSADSDDCEEEENCNCPCSTQEGEGCKNCGTGSCMVALLSIVNSAPFFQDKFNQQISVLRMDSIIPSPITPPPKV